MTEKTVDQLALERLTNVLLTRTDYTDYVSFPANFIKDELHLNLWEKQKEMVEAVKTHRRVIVESGHSTGKSFCSAMLTCWWLSSYEDAVVVTLAPCYDDKTEILTDQGWKLFKDLDRTEKVAQLEENEEMTFVKPTSYAEFWYEGEMLGCQSQLIDFLVTPNHRCLFDTFVGRRVGFKGKILSAEEIYGRNGRFRRIANWNGEDTGVSKAYAEFLGFWFAEGWSEFNPKDRKYRTVLTNSDIEYTQDVINMIGYDYCVQEKSRKGMPNHYKHVFDFTIYNKPLAKELVQYGKSTTKRVPNKIKSARPEIIRAFLDGYRKGDGCIDKNGSERLYTASKQLADDLQELCLKAGYIANISKRLPSNKEDSFHSNSSYYYAVSVWHKRGNYPTVYKKSGWYKEQYKGFVRCVEVPSGIVLVRRNGKYLWSGNTFAQVQNILWRYIRHLGRKYKLPPEIFETPRWNISPLRYAVGLSPKKGTKEDAITLQGYHSPNLLVIMDEAPGLPRSMWESVMSLATSDNNIVLAIGNPIEQAGPFWDAANSPNWHKIRMSCLDHPNVVTDKEVIPGAVSRQWVEEMIRDHCVAASVEEGELERRLGEAESEQEALAITSDVSVAGAPGTFIWKGITYLPNAVFESKVLGRPPQEGSDQLISLAWVEHARNWENITSGETIIGFDPARYGGDQAAMTLRIGGRVLWIKRRRPITKNPSFEWASWIQSEVKELKSYWIMIDEIGVGAGTLDACRQMGLNVRGVSYSKKAFNPKKYHSLRDECWWRLKEKLQKGELSLPNDDMLEGDLTAPKYGFDELGRIRIEEKENTKKRLGRSPDSGDSLAVTFGFPSLTMWDSGDNPVHELKNAGGSRWFLATKPGGSRWNRKKRFIR